MSTGAGLAGISEESPFIPFPSRRSVVHSTRGIVSCTNPLAAQAGLDILREGGNAADAAVATAAVLNLVDPSMTGIGGDVFCLFYDARIKKVRSLNGSGRSPAGATLEAICKALDIVEPANAVIPRTSIHAVTVPGAAAAWVDTVEQFGSGKVSLKQVLAPAIRLAEEGFPVSQISAHVWASSEQELKTTSKNGFELLKKDPADPSGFRAPREGEVFKSPLLASTFRQLAEKGKAGFYEGPVAEAIIAETQSKGGFHTIEDLIYHAKEGSEIGEAISLKLGQPDASEQESANSVNGLELWEHPPNGQGIVALMALGLLQQLEKTGKISKLSHMGHNSAKYLHAIIETLRIAFADASWFIADPDPSFPDTIQPERLLSPTYLAERAQLFNPNKVTYVDRHGSPAYHASDTVYFAVTDSEGSGCSFVNSVSDRFGSCIVPPGTGFALQNRGSSFRLDPGHPNAFAPRKRPFNTIIPAIVTNTRDDSLRTVFGVMGGFMQPQGHVQVFLNMNAFGFSPQVALDAPRICIGAPIPGKSLDPSKVFDMTVYLEEGISDEVARELETMGHEVKLVLGQGRSLFGRGQVINVGHDAVTGQKAYSAGSDPRGDGAAVPL